jgi:hypothetical protein
MLEKLRLYFFNKSLQKMLREEQTERRPTDFQSARSVGILFDATDEQARKVVRDYAADLSQKGKKVELLGFVNDKKKQEDPGFPFFTPKEIDWFYRPKQAEALAFARKAFDVLVCAYAVDAKPLEYLSALSKAHLRVGRYQEDRTHCFDLMIDNGQADDLAGLIRQMDQYLNIVNRKKSQHA